ncbi:MAG: RNA polymerase sigma factor [Steroidobacteraceae bacterium]
MDAILGMTGERLEQDRQIAAAERFRAPLRGFLRRYLHNDSEAEDLVQDVYYELVVAARLMHPIEEVGAWLFRVARNRMVDLFRRRKRHARYISDDLPDLDEWIPAPDGSPETEYARGLLFDELMAALQALPEAQRAVFIAHELEGETFEAMAERTQTPLNTLLARKHRAVKALRARLQTFNDLPDIGPGDP